MDHYRLVMDGPKSAAKKGLLLPAKVDASERRKERDVSVPFLAKGALDNGVQL
jgi:hypothetical protein